MLKLGIVTTVADSDDSIEAFIQYHQKIGFTHFYIFIDDNDLEVFGRLKRCTGVYVFLRDAKLFNYWQENFSEISEKKRQLIEKEVMVRQELNFYVAYDLARRQGVDWVLHIDLDELFYPNGHSLGEYFGDLQLKNFSSATFLNYESISTKLESNTIYLSSRYFKVNYFKNRYWFYTREQQEFIASNDWLKRKYFLFYQNGKSIVNTYGGKIVFHDVHSIMGDGNRKMGGHDDPIILHFPCARLSDFDKKYRRLGDFPDDWLDAPRAGEFIDDFHLHARNMFRTASPAECKAFYEANCVFDDLKIEQLCNLGLAKFIDFHLKFF